MWPHKRSRFALVQPFASEHGPGREPPSLDDAGAIVAIEQAGEWVRFADTKATILAAGVGVVLAVVATSAADVGSAIKAGGAGAWLVAVLGTATIAMLVLTIGSIARAIRPRIAIEYAHVNRFAWPSVAAHTEQELADRATSEPHADAWEQVHALSIIARSKFAACTSAITWFALLVLLSFLCVTAAAFVKSADEASVGTTRAGHAHQLYDCPT